MSHCHIITLSDCQIATFATLPHCQILCCLLHRKCVCLNPCRLEVEFKKKTQPWVCSRRPNCSETEGGDSHRMSLLSPSLRTPLGCSTPRWQSAAVSLRANSLAGWWLRCAIPSRQLLTDGGRAPVSTMVSKMSARPDPPVSPARWENSDQTPSGNTCCYLEDTKLTCADRFMSRQWKLDGTIKYIDCNQKVPRRRIFATIFIIGISTEERLQKT